jgi:hypothetical protein
MTKETFLLFIYLHGYIFLLFHSVYYCFFPIPTAWWWITYAVWFFIGHIKLRGPFGLMLHNITHRRLFKKKYDWLNKYVIWFVCPFFGHTPETYFVHHVGMHHEENNMDDDTSSTLAYQRDSVIDFIKYYLNFIFLGFKETFMYLYYKKEEKVLHADYLWRRGFFCALCCNVFYKPASGYVGFDHSISSFKIGDDAWQLDTTCFC